MSLEHLLKQLPNFITLSSIFAACLALVYLESEAYTAVTYCIAYSLIADFLDGALARLLHARSELGKQLDSLADLVAFGVVPGLLVYHLLKPSGSLSFIGFLLPMSAAMRLGKFNLDNRQTDFFLGLPTPSVAIFFAGWVLVIQNDSFQLAAFFTQAYLIAGMVLLMSVLMLVEIELFSLKFKHFRWEGNQIRFIFALLTVSSIIGFGALGIVISILLYVLLSLISNRRIH